MVKVEGTTIIMVKGDTAYIDIAISAGNGEAYVPDSEDKIRFALKKSYNDAKPLILKEIPNDTLTLTLNPEDTKRLPPGHYKYDVEITMADGTVDTFIPRAELVLLEEVY